jgi:sugar phosphate isomerase/epimerase
MFQLSYFTKPWQQESAEGLASRALRLGLHGIELPVRSGFQVEPENAIVRLPAFTNSLKVQGIEIYSIAASLKEEVFEACAEAGIPLIRIMFRDKPFSNYWEVEKQAKETLNLAARLSEKYGVKVGVQNHSGTFIPQSAMGLYHLIKDYPSRYIGAVFDIAHNALNGEDLHYAIDILASHLAMVNIKNVYREKRAEVSSIDEVSWKNVWTTGNKGVASWSKAVRELERIGYHGVLCLHAEYSNEAESEKYLAEDAVFIQKILNGEGEEDGTVK